MSGGCPKFVVGVSIEKMEGGQAGARNWDTFGVGWPALRIGKFAFKANLGGKSRVSLRFPVESVERWLSFCFQVFGCLGWRCLVLDRCLHHSPPICRLAGPSRAM